MERRLIWRILLSLNTLYSEVKMTTDEGMPGAQAPSEQPTMQAPAAETAASEPTNEDEISKNLIKQVGIVGGIVFLILLAVFFDVI
jgi:hypothetical protein|tara:strand:- start:617 stop:874 length:258 start_codon:yes stop_codon:yes gene_type:complete